MAKYKLKGSVEAEQYVHPDTVPYLQEWAEGNLEVNGSGVDIVIWLGLHRVVLGEYLVKTAWEEIQVFSEKQFNDMFEKVEEGGVITSTQLKNE